MTADKAGLYVLMMCVLSAQLWGQIMHVMGSGKGVDMVRGDGVLGALWTRAGDRSEALVRTIDATMYMQQQNGT